MKSPAEYIRQTIKCFIFDLRSTVIFERKLYFLGTAEQNVTKYVLNLAWLYLIGKYLVIAILKMIRWNKISNKDDALWNTIFWWIKNLLITVKTILKHRFRDGDFRMALNKIVKRMTYWQIFFSFDLTLISKIKRKESKTSRQIESKAKGQRRK